MNPYKMTVSLRDGTTFVAESRTRSNLSSAADFISALAREDPEQSFTISPASGPELTVEYGQIAMIKIEVPQ